MAKFFISNNIDLYTTILDYNSSFVISNQYKNEKINACVFNKIIKPQHNHYFTPSGGIYIVGTPIHDKIAPLDIPKYVYESFSLKNIAKIQKELLGIWAVFVVKDDKIYCFNDYYGLYDIFYFNKDNNYVIGNALSDIIPAQSNIEFDEFPFVMENCFTGAFPGITMFKDIFKLKGNQFIEVNSDTFSVRQFNQEPIVTGFNSVEESISYISDGLLYYCKKISDYFGNVAMLMTGGLDSRLLFAGFNSVCANIVNIHGISNGSCKEDKEIVDDISKFYNKRLEYLDWSYEDIFSLDNQAKVFNEIGFYNWMDAGNHQYFDEIKRIAKQTNFLQAGYFCEALRLREWAENKGGQVFSIYDYIDDYYLNDTFKSLYPNIIKFREYLIFNFISLLREIGYEGDVKEIPMDLFEKFRWIMARFSDSRYTVMINLYMPSFLVMGIPKIH